MSLHGNLNSHPTNWKYKKNKIDAAGAHAKHMLVDA